MNTNELILEHLDQFLKGLTVEFETGLPNERYSKDETIYETIDLLQCHGRQVIFEVSDEVEIGVEIGCTYEMEELTDSDSGIVHTIRIPHMVDLQVQCTYFSLYEEGHRVVKVTRRASDLSRLFEIIETKIIEKLKS